MSADMHSAFVSLVIRGSLLVIKSLRFLPGDSFQSHFLDELSQ